jgi:flavodoxin
MDRTFLYLSLLFGLSVPSFSQKSDTRILIVYLTRTNNTKAVAEIIQEKVNGVLVGLELEIPYPEDYQAHVDQVVKENETGFLPLLKTKVDVSKYDTLFIGFPTWGMQLPPPVKSFLHNSDLAKKTVIPFNTHAGYGVGSGFNTVQSMCPKSTVLEGLSVEGGHERRGIMLAIKDNRAKEVETLVDKWLSALKIMAVD